ncbi:MAG: DNA primase, partial [Gemmatimonadaceae bacterium]
MISDETIERVREGADIVQIIGEFVKLKKSGNSYRGPCPFHNGSGPNFSVSPKEGIYHCFVCGVSGDSIKFIREKLNLDFTAAVKMVGEKSGIEVIDAPNRIQAPDPNARHWEVLASSAEWFQKQLADEVIGREARQYLTGRGLNAEAITRFGIGFAPSDRAALRKYLHSLGFDDQRQLDAGMLSAREGETEPRMNFRNRVMFPIIDELGHNVGFGGRAMGDAVPKYLNSAESSVFKKGKTLYGMNTAKHAIRRAERAIVVEGYMDAISVVLAGFEEVVAPLGTALTEQQAELLGRYTQEVFLFYDSDQAGQKATFRAGLELLRHKSTVRVVTLPDDDDPDTFARREGHAGLEKLFAQ